MRARPAFRTMAPADPLRPARTGRSHRGASSTRGVRGPHASQLPTPRMTLPSVARSTGLMKHLRRAGTARALTAGTARRRAPRIAAALRRRGAPLSARASRANASTACGAARGHLVILDPPGHRAHRDAPQGHHHRAERAGVLCRNGVEKDLLTDWQRRAQGTSASTGSCSRSPRTAPVAHCASAPVFAIPT
jgi:hypothetical protein